MRQGRTVPAKPGRPPAPRTGAVHRDSGALPGGTREAMRLRRSDPTGPGYTRRRRGRGFSYLDEHGRALSAAEVRRCRALVIPPAWRDVWICPDPAGHIQAMGTDAAGRRQYRYHPQWRQRRDRHKFAHVRDVAAALPRLRRRVRVDLADRRLSRQRVLALAVRLIDLGLFRVGGDEYAGGDGGTYGVATLTASHVSCNGHVVRFRYPAKGGIPREDVVCFDDYVGPGYSLPTEGMVEAVKLLAQTEGILLDPVYTGKAMAGLLDLIRKGYFRKGQNVLFVHTGGSPALHPYAQYFSGKD